MKNKYHNEMVNILNHLHAFTDSQIIYGKSITYLSRTVIPVSTLSFGFGAGLLASKKIDKKGIGFGIHAKPIGYILIEKQNVSFIPIKPTKHFTHTILMLSISCYFLIKTFKLFR